MRKIYPVLVAGLIAVSAIQGLRAQGAAPATASWTFLGRWRANFAKSSMSSTGITVTRAASGDMTILFQGLSQTFRIDGKERPAVLGSTAAWTQTGPRSWRTVYRMAKVENNIDTYSLSDDGKTLTMKTEYLLPKHMEQTLIFKRQSGDQGLVGAWKTESVQNDQVEFELSARDARTLFVNFFSIGGTVTAPIDGTDTPVVGPQTMVASGLAMSFKVTGAGSFEMTQKMNGTVFSTGHFTVAADGRTMTCVATNGPATAERFTMIFEKQ